MVKISLVKTDEDLREEGFAIEYVHGFTVWVTSMPNPKFNEFIRKRSGVLKRGRRVDISPEEMEAITKEGVARFVVLRWEGLEEDDGVTAIDCSWQRCHEFFNDPGWTHFYSTVCSEAADQANFRKREEEDDAGK